MNCRSPTLSGRAGMEIKDDLFRYSKDKEVNTRLAKVVAFVDGACKPGLSSTRAQSLTRAAFPSVAPSPLPPREARQRRLRFLKNTSADELSRTAEI